MPNALICFSSELGSSDLSGTNRGTSTASLTWTFLVSFGGRTSRIVQPSDSRFWTSFAMTFLTIPSRSCTHACLSDRLWWVRVSMHTLLCKELCATARRGAPPVLRL